MIPANQIMQLSSRAFWDVDMSKLDYENKAYYIIRKVFEYGTLEDVVEAWAYYGDKKTKHALTSAPYLMAKTVHFASMVFHTPLPDFACYTSKQYHPIF